MGVKVGVGVGVTLVGVIVGVGVGVALVGVGVGTSKGAGDNNGAIGSQALSHGNTGGNVAIGFLALRRATGLSNVAIGRQAGLGDHNNSPFSQSLTTGTENVFIGAYTQVPSGSGDINNSVVIGYGAISKGTNTTIIGNDSTTLTYLMGQVTASSAYITSITGSLFGTASYATTASFALNAGSGTTLDLDSVWIYSGI